MSLFIIKIQYFAFYAKFVRITNHPYKKGMSGNIIENVQKMFRNCQVCPENVLKNDQPFRLEFSHVQNLYT